MLLFSKTPSTPIDVGTPLFILMRTECAPCQICGILYKPKLGKQVRTRVYMKDVSFLAIRR